MPASVSMYSSVLYCIATVVSLVALSIKGKAFVQQLRERRDNFAGACTSVLSE